MALFDILVNIAANTAQFSQGIDKATRQLEQFGDKVTKAFEVVGVGLGLKQLVDDFDAFIDRAEQTRLAAQKIGIAVDELSRLQFAAAASGVSTEQLTTGVERFSRVVETAIQGVNLQSQAFQAMGISLRDTSGNLKPINDLLNEVADKFASYKDGLEKTALAQILFSRGGAEMIPLLNQGSEGLRELGQRSDELGNTLNSTVIKSAKEFNEKLTELRGAANGFWQAVASQLTPALISLVQYITESTQAAGGLVNASRPLVTAIKAITDAATTAATIFEDLGTAQGAQMATWNAILHGHLSEVKDIWHAFWEDLQKRHADADKFLDILWSDQIDSSQHWKDSLVDDWSQLANAAKKSAPEVAAAAEDMQAQWLVFLDKMNTQTETLTNQMGNRINNETLTQLNSLQKQGTAYAKHMWDTIDEISQQGARNMQSAFSDFFFDPVSKGFSGLVIDLANALRRMVADVAAAQLFKALFGTDKEGNSGLGGILSGLLGSLFGGGKAAGGPLDQGKWYVAGERGPEPIWGGGGGAFATGYGSMAPNISINTSIDARGATTDLVAALPRIMKQNNEDLENQIITRLRRNVYG